jgi:hypothetical protein
VIASVVLQDAVSGHLFGVPSGGKRLDRMIDVVAVLLEQSVRAVVRDPSKARRHIG